ncbi:carboxylesterase family protein [Mycobacterium sp. CPCC 205710]|uniref:Carboxylic ester hydrolase n=1 Tax=Mycobacterium deserti TaxID=2978347 RepID=A0ABT2M7G5_9MYCO|nr:carboxylesterase family protein [Mycobacterium deserti]MCT7658206.1 carboxylesterase family protein [Mycobacterium deserti]
MLTVLAGCGRGDTAVGVPVDPAVARTVAGPVRGTVADDHRYFAGIPYAAPPVGPLRWQSPAPTPGWTQLRDATRPGPRCVQDTSTDPDPRATSEDCLTLNVWTPPPADELRPVMVWIHGGGFFNGSGDIYNARRMVSRGGIVVVNINYRLGALGYLAHPALGDNGDVGNYGLADQQAALRWVRDNIAGFGGDPDKVTIAGESAGGMSVCDHLVAPGSAGLFRAAIIQSAPCQAQYDLPTAQMASEAYAAEIGCGETAVAAQCLRSLPADKLQKGLLYGRIGTERLGGPVTGTPALPVNPVVGMGEGRAARVPVMIGSNRDEFTLFAAIQHLHGRPMGPADYPGLLGEAFGRHADAVAQRYPIDRYGGSVPLAYSAAMTDGDFACVTELMADALAEDQPVYGYEFNDRNAPGPAPLREVPFPVGATHSLELRYLFDVGGAPQLDSAQQRLSDEMIDYWTRFVATGAPGSDWPEMGENASGKRISLQPNGNQIITDFGETHQCAFWAGLRG